MIDLRSATCSRPILEMRAATVSLIPVTGLAVGTGGHDAPNAQGFSALLVPEQIAQGEFANLTPDSGQR